jgi:single-strand DNA-binding protein
MNYNKVLLGGRLTRNPELRYTPQGLPVTEIGIAVNRDFPSGGGSQGQDRDDRRRDTVFVEVTIWRRRAEVVCQYLRKGDPIFIEGRLILDAWETQDGQRRSRLKVVADNFQFVGPSRGGRDTGEYNSQYAAPRSSPPAEGGQPGSYAEYEYPGVPAQEPRPSSSSPPSPAPPPSSWENEKSGGEPEEERLDDSDIPF